MKRSLLLKILGGFGLIVLLVAGSLLILLSTQSARVLQGVVHQADEELARDLADELADWYAARGSWAGVEELLNLQRGTMGSMMGMPMGSMMMSRGGGWGTRPSAMMMGMMQPIGRILVTDNSDKVILDTGDEAGDSPEPVELGEPVRVRGRTIAQVRVGTMINPELTEEARQFLSKIRRGVVGSASIVTVLALGLGLIVFRQIMRPLTHLSDASRRIAAGEQGVRVVVNREDEIGRLSQQFNSMIESVEAGRERQKQFAAEAAHELRTPVSLIQGTLEMMLEGVYPMSDERVAALHEEALRLADLVSDLQQLSASDKIGFALENTRLELGEVVGSALALFEDQITAKGVAIKREIESGIWILGDGNRLQQVLKNLLHNALRYTADGGSIEISCAAELTMSAAIVCVHDTGPGIPTADREKVFQRFYRVDPSRSRGSGGTGLGLAIAREIVVAHGGSIWVDSSCTAGARVCFKIPVA